MQVTDATDTFEDGPYTDGPMDELESFDDEGAVSGEEDGEEGQSTEEKSVQTEEPEDFDTDSQVNLLDEKEDAGTEKKEEGSEKGNSKEDEKSEKSDEDSESDESPENDASKDVRDTAEDIRNLKAFRDGKQYEIPEDAQIQVKVNGKSEKVSLTDLRDNYSGKVAYDEKFSTLTEERNHFKSEKESYNAEIETIKEHFGNIRQLTERGMSGEVDPVSSMNYMLDLMGINTVDYNKAMFNHMSEEFDMYAQMTESERDAHWTKRENAYLVKKQESLTTRQAEEKTQADLNQHVNSLREAHSISEEDYVSAENDLKSENFQGITPEKIVQAAKLKPLLSQADDMLGKYSEQLTDEEYNTVSVDIATTMLNTPELTVDQVKLALAEQFEVESIMTEIEKKTGPAKQVKTSSAPSTDELDMFDD